MNWYVSDCKKAYTKYITANQLCAGYKVSLHPKRLVPAPSQKTIRYRWWWWVLSVGSCL